MSDISLSTNTVTVLGGPTQLDVNVDFGPAGQRGSLFFVGFGNPNDLDLNSDFGTDQVLEKDVFINVLRSDDEFSFLYQYDSSSGNWNTVANILPVLYADNLTRTFQNGQINLTLNIPSIVNLNTVQNLSAENFNIQYNILGQGITSSTMTIGTISNNILPVTINAIEYDGDSWSPVNGTKTIHLVVTLTRIVV